MRHLVFLAVFVLSVAAPKLASACTCVTNPDVPFTIQRESKDMFAIGIVREVRFFETNPTFSVVVVDIAEPILNVKPGEVITLFTRTLEESCGYSRFVPGARYVIESTHFAALPPSPDPIDRMVFEQLWRGVPAGSQIVGRCGRTRSLDTPEGAKALSEIREALTRLHAVN